MRCGSAAPVIPVDGHGLVALAGHEVEREGSISRKLATEGFKLGNKVRAGEERVAVMVPRAYSLDDSLSKKNSVKIRCTHLGPFLESNCEHSGA